MPAEAMAPTAARPARCSRARAIPAAGAIAPARPDFEAAGPDFEAAERDSEAAEPDFEAKITGVDQQLSETGRCGSVWHDIGAILILQGLRSLWDASWAPKRPIIVY